MPRFCINRFLWIEDFNASVTKTVKAVFGGIIPEEYLSIQVNKYKIREILSEHGIFVELTFTSAMRFIRNPEQLAQIDYVLLDIKLPLQEENDEPLDDMEQILANYENKGELEEKAGYQIYLELLMHCGFPKERILFCSDHGTTLETIKQAVKEAKIPVAHEIREKISPDSIAAIQDWISERCTPDKPYDVLRKGIFEGCRVAYELIDQDAEKIQFSEFIKGANAIDLQVEMQDYLKTLQALLPVREPAEKKFKLFIRTLTHEWEDKAQPDNPANITKDERLKHTLGQIMKCARNWTAHTSEFNTLAEKQLAFFFLVAMRAMFELPDAVQEYEKLLLKLYEDAPPPGPDDIEQRLSASYTAALDAYATILGGKNKLQPVNLDKIDFITLLKTMQWHDKENRQQFDYIRGLLQMFWHGLSPITLRNPKYRQDAGKLHFDCEYSFDLHDYGRSRPDGFLCALTYAIYNER
ncbi:MAG: hypothetical protein GY862_23400 [Gammaproteobacteria bacterium]|nr:hypothetical protein [Gammaproteobacteria bacterium]